MTDSPNPNSSNIPATIAMIVSDPHDGWWFRGVFEAFGFLERDFGYRLAEVHQHFRGNYVRYEGTAFDLVVEHDPEDTGHVSAELWVHDDLPPRVEHPRAFTVNHLLRSRDPKRKLPDLRRGNYDHVDALDALTTWAAGLRDLAPDVLRGEWPTDVPFRYLW